MIRCDKPLSPFAKGVSKLSTKGGDRVINCDTFGAKFFTSVMKNIAELKSKN